MQYEPIKRSLGRFIAGSSVMRKIFYFLLDLLLLRTWHIKKAIRKMASTMPADASVLDAGSGFGQYVWWMSKANPAWKIMALDINSVEVEACNSFFRKAGKGERVTFLTEDLTNLNDVMTYDLILSVDVMEHIREDEMVLRNFYNALKNDGQLIISTPSDRGGSDVHDAEDKSFIDEHVRNGYSVSGITGKLNKAGFTRINASYTYGKPGKISWLLTMKWPVKMLNISYLFFAVFPIYFLIFFPVSIILNIFDLCLVHESGTGLLVTARKAID